MRGSIAGGGVERLNTGKSPPGTVGLGMKGKLAGIPLPFVRWCPHQCICTCNKTLIVIDVELTNFYDRLKH